MLFASSTGRRLTALAVFVLTGGHAVAQDSGATDWSRPYAGVSVGLAGVGGTAERSGQSDVELDFSSVSFGGYAGATLWEPGADDGRGWLLGVEASAANLTGDDTSGAYKLNGGFIADAGLQIGYAWEKARLFGEVGVALTNARLSGPGDKTRSLAAGVSLGAGLDYAITSDWTARAEASLAGFGKEDAKFEEGSGDAGIGVGRFQLGVARRF